MNKNMNMNKNVVETKKFAVDKDTEGKLKEYLSSVNRGTEFEIRLGKFVYDRETKKSNFESNVEIDFFYKLKNVLDDKGVDKEVLFTKEYSYPNMFGKGNIRKIVKSDKTFTENKGEEYLLKNSYKKYNVFEYDVRLSLASEKTIRKESMKGVNWSAPQFVRYKNRESYIFNFGKIDLTIVSGGDGSDNLTHTYEVELEITRNDYDMVLQFLTFMLQQKQNNPFVISNSEKRDVFNKYKGMTGVPFFVGVQPETLQKDQLTLLYKELYSVTDKADGERHFMFIDDDGRAFFMDSNLNKILKTNLNSTIHRNCLIDGELISNVNDEEMFFYAFDLLFFDGHDIRGDTRYHFKQRLDKLKLIVSGIESNSIYKINVKKFIYRNVFLGSEVIMKDIKNKSYENDGLIFTPMNEPYPKTKKWSKLLKWKPVDQNTIDFYAVKSDGKWLLYVQGVETKTNDFKSNTTLVLFNISEICPNLPDTKEITFETYFDDSLIDPTTNKPYQSNTVIEFKWDFDSSRFVPLRTRWDKTSNPKKHGNFVSVACSIWNNIHNPVKEETLYQMTNETTITDSQNPFFFETLIKFGNKIKEYLGNKYCKDAQYLLDICQTKAKHNGLYSNVPNIYGFDLIKKRENHRRHNNKNFYDIPFDMFRQSNNTKDLCEMILPENNLLKRFDVSLCQNFNTFFESRNCLENLVNVLKYALTENGKVIMFFFDEVMINKTFPDSFTSQLLDNELLYSINKSNTKSSEFNNSYKIYVKEISNENEMTCNIINYSFLLEFMKDNGFDLDETEILSNLCTEKFELSHYERNIASIQRFCVFKKCRNKEDFVLQDIKPINKQFNVDYTNTLALDKDITLHKVTNLSDIIDVINCVEFKYNKFTIDDKVIHEYEQIRHFLNEISDEDTPMLINSNDIDTIEPKDRYITFYQYQHEQLNDTDFDTVPEIIVYTYIVLYKSEIYQTFDNIKTLYSKLVNKTKQVHVETNVKPFAEPLSETLSEPLDAIKMTIRGILASKEKLTIPVLKNYLKSMNEKTTGKKDELLKRLSSVVNK